MVGYYFMSLFQSAFFENAMQFFATAFHKNQGIEGLILNLSKVGTFAFTSNHFHFMGQLGRSMET